MSTWYQRYGRKTYSVAEWDLEALESHHIEQGSPPSENEIRYFHLCRVTGRSLANLKRQIALVGGNLTAFRMSIGSLSYQNFRTIDAGYWRIICQWTEAFIPQWEKALMDALALPEEQITEQVARSLGIPVDFLTVFQAHRLQVKQFVESIREDMVTMAEVKLLELISTGDPATLRWYLARAAPEKYGNRKIDPEDNEVLIRFAGD